MSWIDKIKNPLQIKTGDGRTFTVIWKNAARSQEYNVAEFEFPETDGTLVKRSRPKGMRYNIEFYFQGEFHLDDAKEFKDSADDPRAWVITHPFYDAITVQPLTLNYTTGLNVTTVTGTIVETITEDRPRTSVDPKDKISTDKTLLDETFASAFATNVKPDTTDIIRMQNNNTLAYEVGKKRVVLTEDAEKYFNLFNEANTKILDATGEPLAAMQAMQAALNAPALFADSVTNRVNTLINQFNLLRDTIEGITEPNKKRVYENNGGSLVSSMLLASSTPAEGDYENRDQVFDMVALILENYNLYILDLDELQTDNGGELDSYIPDAGSMIAINELLNFTLSNLFNIALNSRQERSVILEDDSNIILLAHRFYGLSEDDSTIEEFRKQNGIGLNEILHVRKGRPIKYYV